jgi:hypothetical protein
MAVTDSDTIWNQNHDCNNEKNGPYPCAAKTELPNHKTEGTTKTPRGFQILSLKDDHKKLLCLNALVTNEDFA